MQANFVKSAVYVPLSTYYRCTNLQVVKVLLRECVIKENVQLNREIVAARGQVTIETERHNDIHRDYCKTMATHSNIRYGLNSSS